MSYMRPYFFSGSANMSMSIWMRANAYAPKVGLALSGSTSSLAVGSVNAWQAESTFSCAAIRTVLPSDAVYVIENTSTTDLQEGAFGMYLTQAETASVQAGFMADAIPWPITATTIASSPRAGKMFVAMNVGSSATNTFSYSASLQVFNSFTYQKERDLYTTGSLVISDGAGNIIASISGSRCAIDVAYNSVDDQIYVLTGWPGQLDNGGTVGLSVGFLEIWNSSGSVLVESHSLGTGIWGSTTFQGGNLIYNPNQNQMLVIPKTFGPGAVTCTASIFDCTSKTVLSTFLPPYALGSGCFVSSSHTYFVAASVVGSAALKINALTYVTASTNITNSTILCAFPEIDVLIGNGGAYANGFVPPPCIIDPINENIVAEIPGILDFETPCTYDSCQKCLVIADDCAGDPGFSAGGLCWVYSGSWEPKNFFALNGAYAIAFDSAASTIWGGNYSSMDTPIVRTSVPTGSIQLPPFVPPPEAPPVPQNLRVRSGSAVLDWEKSGSGAVDFYTIYKSTTSEAGPYVELTASVVTHSVDEAVTTGNSYWYKDNATVGAATSSYTNPAQIDLIVCNSASFQPIIHQGYVTYTTASAYSNIYGKIIRLVVPVEFSASMWLRSPDFDPYLTIADSAGTIISSSNYDGWSPPGDYVVNGATNAALTFNFPSGTYDIEVSSYDNRYGRYNLIISPGATLECTWSNAYETSNTDYIPTSDVVAIGAQGGGYGPQTFFNTLTKEVKTYSWATTQGSCYSPVQDRVFAWTYDGDGVVGWTASLVEYDNTGSQVARTDYPRPLTRGGGTSRLTFDGYIAYLTDASGNITDLTGFPSGSRVYAYDPFSFTPNYTVYVVSASSALTMSVNVSHSDIDFAFQITPPQVTPNVDFNGYLCYDGKHDRILLHEYDAGNPQQAVVFDCATRTITASLNFTPHNPGFGSAWESCYSWIDDTFYMALTGNNKMVKINASTFAMSTSSVASNIIASYLSQSNLMMIRQPGTGLVQFFSPVSNSVVHTMTTLPTTGYLECGGVGDKCSNVYVAAIDPRSGEGDVTNHPCLALIDRNTYLPSNFIILTDDSPGGFAADGWYQYSMAISEKTSRIYSSTVDYDTYTGRLYSTLPTVAIYAEQTPYQATAADTASCMTFKQQYKITGSLSGSGTTGWVCSTKKTGSATLAISNFEIDLGIGGFPWHNYGTWFMAADGSQTLATYTGSYIHTLSGKNAVHAYGKYYMLSDGTQYQAGWTPTSGSNMLVFDNSGSLLTTIPLSYPARDWDTDGDSIHILEADGTNLWYEAIDCSTDAISTTNQIVIDFSMTPAPMSATMSAAQPMGLKQYPMFGRMVAVKDTNGTVWTYINDIKFTAADAFCGDRVSNAAGGWAAVYGQDLSMGENGFTAWHGGAAYCPITNTMFWGAAHTSSNCVIETNMNLGILRVINISFTISTIVYNPKNRTMEFYSDDELGPGTNNGAIYVYDPTAKTNVCGFWATNNTGGPAGGNGIDGSGGYNIDVNVYNGDIYFPQRIDSGSASPATGSVKVYRV